MTQQSLNESDAKVEALNIDEFSKRVVVAIEKAGGATKMAEKAGVSGSVLRKWRSGSSEPSRVNLIKLADAAGVSVEWLATGKEPRPIEGKEEGWWTSYFERSKANGGEEPSVNEAGRGKGESIFEAHMARKEKAEKEYWQQSLPASFYARLVPTLNKHSSDAKTIEKLLDRVISMVMVLTVDLKTWPEHISDEHLEQLVAIAAAAIQQDDKARANDAWF
ncbi:helix-turn-helix domain-containing protein [Halomonas sp. CSM-2]|uniref:helix-turn-helix domain-containing protein n=1 Tax=Halomonas sp. CSM-2 TaxID=1975722 RepID=UPI000A280B7B|nr:helix-turn-helix transcriptional regulator [Halomonas sp. CSM-2]